MIRDQRFSCFILTDNDYSQEVNKMNEHDSFTTRHSSEVIFIFERLTALSLSLDIRSNSGNDLNSAVRHSGHHVKIFAQLSVSRL